LCPSLTPTAHRWERCPQMTIYADGDGVTGLGKRLGGLCACVRVFDEWSRMGSAGNVGSRSTGSGRGPRSISADKVENRPSCSRTAISECRFGGFSGAFLLADSE